MWSGPLHDKTFVEEVLKHVEESEAEDASTATEAPTTEDAKNSSKAADASAPAPAPTDASIEGHVFKAKYGTAARMKGMLTVASEVRAFVVHVYTTDQ